MANGFGSLFVRKSTSSFVMANFDSISVRDGLIRFDADTDRVRKECPQNEHKNLYIHF